MWIMFEPTFVTNLIWLGLIFTKIALFGRIQCLMLTMFRCCKSSLNNPVNRMWLYLRCRLWSPRGVDFEQSLESCTIEFRVCSFTSKAKARRTKHRQPSQTTCSWTIACYLNSITFNTESNTKMSSTFLLYASEIDFDTFRERASSTRASLGLH